MPSSVECPICRSAQVRLRLRLPKFNILRCPDCSLLMLSHIPSEQELESLYSHEYYEERSEYYFNNPVWDPEHGRNTENIAAFKAGLERLRQLKPEGKTLLDVGCGLGIFLAMARDSGWDVKGVDTSEYAVKYAREHFKLDVSHSAILSDAKFAPESFDVITLWDSIEHFRDPVAQMTEVFRLLKPGGVVMLDTPNGESLLRTLANVCYDLTLGLFKYPVIKLYHRFHLYYYTQRALRTLLDLTHFELIQVELRQIPVVKARGTRVEKELVRLFSHIERHTGRAFELIVYACKPATADKPVPADKPAEGARA